MSEQMGMTLFSNLSDNHHRLSVLYNCNQRIYYFRQLLFSVYIKPFVGYKLFFYCVSSTDKRRTYIITNISLFIHITYNTDNVTKSIRNYSDEWEFRTVNKICNNHDKSSLSSQLVHVASMFSDALVYHRSICPSHCLPCYRHPAGNFKLSLPLSEREKEKPREMERKRGEGSYRRDGK